MFRLISCVALACASFATWPITSAGASSPVTRMTTVMVELKGAPLAADSNMKVRDKSTLNRFRLDATLLPARWYSGALASYQGQELAYIRHHGIHIRLIRQFHVLFNGFSVTIPTSEVSQLRSLPNVKGVMPQHYYHPLDVNSFGLVHAIEAWQHFGGGRNAGKGMMIAQIDTGIDITSPCFSDAGFAPSPFGRRYDNSANGALTNNKVIVARAFGSDPTSPYSAADTGGHGTMGAAIEACDYNTPTPLGPKISGVAPGAYLMNYNVFADSGKTSDTSVLSALEAALLDGADVANMSLGGDFSAGDPSLDFQSQQVDLATKAGMTMVIAAGNAGPTGRSVSSPGSAPSAIAVGSTTNSQAVSATAHVSGTPDVPAGLINIQANEGSHPFTSSVGPAPVVFVGLGRLPNDDTTSPTANDFAGKDLHGKIALIQRGTIFFATKINNAAKQGAVGVIIYDNVNDISLFQMDVQSATLPAMSISQDAGKALLAYLQAHPDAHLALDPTLSAANETPNVLSNFSSRGYDANYTMKPDLLAPGQDIYSATEAQIPNSELYNPSGFTSASGTSFSAPHVAGAAALVLQAHPKWTPAQVRAVLKEYASSDVVVDPSRATPSVTDIGGGLLNVTAALSATAYAEPDTATFGEINVASGTVHQSQTFTLSDAGGGTGTWNVKLQAAHGPSNGLTLSLPTSVTVPSGGQASFTVTASADASAANNDFDGYIVMSRGSESLHVPYFAHVINGPVTPGSVLLVDDTASRFVPTPPAQPSVRKDVSSYYINALKAIGKPYTYWDEAKLGSASYNDMKAASAVIFYTGANLGGFGADNQDPQALDGPLSSLDTSAMHQYLDAGGRVFVTGEGVTLSDGFWSAVVMGTGYANASVYDNNDNDPAHKGGISPTKPSAKADTRTTVHANPYVFAGMKAIDFSTGGDGAGTNTAVYSKAVETDLGDSMFGVNGLTPFFGNAAPFGNAYGKVALRPTNLPLAKGNDVAVVSSDEPSFTHKSTYKGRGVLFSFGFEGINDNTGYATRAQVLQRIFQWFADKPSVSIPAGSYSSGRSVLLKATLHGQGVHAVSYVWKIGKQTVSGGGRGAYFVFPHAGAYSMRVLVTDSLGHAAVSASRTIHVK